MNKYIKNHRVSLWSAVFCVFLSSVCAVTLQFFKGNVLDYAIAGAVKDTICYALLLIGFILLEVLFFYCHGRLSSGFVVSCTRDLKADIFEGILHCSVPLYRKDPQGTYISRYTNEADLIKERRFSMIPAFWEIFFKILFVSAALFLLDWRLALITLFLLSTPLYVPKLIEHKIQTVQNAYIKASEENLTLLNDWLTGFETIKNFSIEKQILKKFHDSNDTAMDCLLSDLQVGETARLITTLISYLSYFIVLACAAGLVLAGDFSAGDFFVAIGMIDQLSYPLIALSGIIRQLLAVRPACEKMEGFLKECKADERRESPKVMQKAIEFTDVDFAYEQEHPLLSHFNLRLEKGKRYLLKGPSGSGKTTVTNLLLRYCNPTCGLITLDGQSMLEYTDASDLITVVRQEAVLFYDTLRNNLSMYQDVSDVRLKETLNLVGLSAFANEEALDGMVTQGGTNFSGGEKKRICLARALLRDTPVLILDEPLANLDDSSAQLIEKLIFSIRNKTILVVSHQFTEENLGRFQEVIDLRK
ncbi:MAG: ABC transporter ATP-binding protein [Clostridiales bacterium]|nr:ABC transporter ATP-binding protein [Clostridiales bacterium]